MKGLVIIVVMATAALIFWQYHRSKDGKKALIALASFSAIIALAIVGNLTRPIIPLFIAHIILVITAWGGLMLYLLRNRYYWWIIISPTITIGLFLILELLTGSGHTGLLGEAT